MTLYDFIKAKTDSEPKRVRLLTSKQACILLRCAPSTLTNWRRNGYMSYLKGGSRYYYKLHEIEAIARYRFDGRMEKLIRRMKKQDYPKLESQ